MKIIIYILEICFLFVIQESLRFDFFEFRPLWLLSGFICICVFENEFTNLIFGLLIGFLLDLFLGNFLGLYIIFFGLTGYILGIICKYFIKINLLSYMYIYSVVLVLFIIINILINFVLYKKIDIINLCKSKYVYTFTESLTFSIFVYYFNCVICYFVGDKTSEKIRDKKN